MHDRPVRRRLAELDPLDAAYARLRRVNAAIDRRDEWEANAALPAELRRPLEQPGPYSLDALRSLRASVMGAIADLEARRSQEFRDRRN